VSRKARPGVIANLARPPQREMPEPARGVLRTNASWFDVRNGTDDSTDIYIYDVIGAWGFAATDLVDAIREIGASRITVRINSPGGDVFDGLAIYNSLRQHSAHITTQVDGIAASAASVIAQAGNVVKMARSSMLMIHCASTLCWGNAQNMAETGKVLAQVDGVLADLYSVAAGGTAEEWLAVMQEERWYSAADAIEAGLADAYSDPEPEPDDKPVQDLATMWAKITALPAESTPSSTSWWETAVKEFQSAVARPEKRGTR
jgi:ATP-dependent protease ClpP protease subunit